MDKLQAARTRTRSLQTALFVAAAQQERRRREEHTADARQAVREYTAAAERKIREALGASAEVLRLSWDEGVAAVVMPTEVDLEDKVGKGMEIKMMPGVVTKGEEGVVGKGKGAGFGVERVVKRRPKTAARAR